MSLSNFRSHPHPVRIPETVKCFQRVISPVQPSCYFVSFAILFVAVQWAEAVMINVSTNFSALSLAGILIEAEMYSAIHPRI